QGGSSGIASTGGRGSSGLYAISLTPIEKDPNDRDIDTEAQAEAAGDAAPAGRGGRAGAGGGTAPSNVQVKMVWDGMDRRTIRLGASLGNISMAIPSPDSHTYLVQAGGGGADGAAASAPGMYTM